jgi:peptidoglycan/LPS O-acetylase OafA/YrhL
MGTIAMVERPLQPESSSSGILAAFRRVTSTGLLIPEIDGLRFVAILSVFVYHLAGDVLRHADPAYAAAVSHGDWFFQFTQKLDFGVPLFFVISGFILALPFAKHYVANQPRVPLSKYYLRRVTRLEPPYLLSLLLLFLLKVASGQSSAYLAPHLLASSLYVHNPVFHGPSLITVVAWSLEIEIQFYILAPALAQIFRVGATLRRIALSGTCIVAAIFQSLLSPESVLHLSVLGYLQYFIAGFLLADLYLSYTPAGKSRWDTISLAGWPALALLLFFPHVLPFLAPFLVALLYFGALQGYWSRRIFANRVLSSVGGMCYTIYLLHNYTIAALGRVTESVILSDVFVFRLGTQLALMIPPVLLISALYFKLVEKPCMEFRITLRSWAKYTAPTQAVVQPEGRLQPDSMS